MRKKALLRHRRPAQLRRVRQRRPDRLRIPDPREAPYPPDPAVQEQVPRPGTAPERQAAAVPQPDGQRAVHVQGLLDRR